MKLLTVVCLIFNAAYLFKTMRTGNKQSLQTYIVCDLLAVCSAIDILYLLYV